MKILIMLMCLIAAALPVSAQEGRVVPIFAGRDLLGGVETGRWIDAKTTAGKLKPDEKLWLFDFATGKKSDLVPGRIKECAEVCAENYCFEGEGELGGEFAVGADAGWNVMPRPAKKLDSNNAAVKKIVADFLTLKGLAKKKPDIKAAYQIDVDGDRAEELVVLANHYEQDANQLPRLGSYSFLLMQKRVAGKLRTILIEGDYTAKNRDSDGSEYTLEAIADLNGDGKMEFLVRGVAYNGEENWTKVIELKNNKPSEVKVLYNYCGV